MFLKKKSQILYYLVCLHSDSSYLFWWDHPFLIPVVQMGQHEDRNKYIVIAISVKIRTHSQSSQLLWIPASPPKNTIVDCTQNQIESNLQNVFSVYSIFT